MVPNDAIVRLARQIDATRKSERLRVGADVVNATRAHGACELHRICGDFVASLNGKLSQTSLELAPPKFAPEMFRDAEVNLMQISSQGRQMQITFQATRELVSTEKYPMPYILEGEVLSYNQRMLERFEVRSLLLFYTVQEDAALWRYYDWRTARMGLVGTELLVSLMEPLF
jgi:hypothetical protein